MATKKRTKIQRDNDLRVIARMYLTGATLSAIAESLSKSKSREYTLTVQQVSYDIKDIRKRWLQSTLVDYNEVRGRELERIDVLEREYWDGWEKSKRDGTTRTASIGVNRGEEHDLKDAKIEQRDGNPVFLRGVQWCVEQRCKIFGLYEPEKFAVVDWREELESDGVSASEIFESIVAHYVEAIESADEQVDSGGETGS